MRPKDFTLPSRIDPRDQSEPLVALKELILRKNKRIATQLLSRYNKTRDCNFISLGPTCIAASILRFAQLRSCSYPLDWAQSGFLTLEELLTREPVEFYLRNILTPSIHYDQEIVKGSTYHRIVDPLQRNYYGFPYFYNPHRSITDDNRDYFMRCISRFKKAIAEPGMIYFVLADYPDQPGNTFLSNLVHNPIPLIELLLKHVRSEFRVWLVRISHNVDPSSMPQAVCTHSRYMSVILIRMPSGLGRNENPDTDITGPIYGQFFLKFLKSYLDEVYPPGI